MSIRGALTTSLALILGLCFLYPATGRAQQSTRRVEEIRLTVDSPAPVSWGREMEELKKKLDKSAESNIKTLETDNAPLAISEARVRGLKLEGNHISAGGPAPMNDFVMELMVTLVNRESRPITGFGVEFANAQSNSVFYVYRHRIDIGVNQDYRLKIAFMAVTGDPSELAIRLVGVRFADETIWGSFPNNPPNVPLRLSPPPSVSQVRPKTADESGIGSSVDARPKLLNNPTPLYTEEARMNRVQGVVILRLLVGADGSVTRVNVVRPLPDGLTEEALRSAYALKFEPARRKDQPAPFWLAVQIEFHLKYTH